MGNTKKTERSRFALHIKNLNWSETQTQIYENLPMFDVAKTLTAFDSSSLIGRLCDRQALRLCVTKFISLRNRLEQALKLFHCVNIIKELCIFVPYWYLKSIFSHICTFYAINCNVDFTFLYEKCSLSRKFRLLTNFLCVIESNTISPSVPD